MPRRTTYYAVLDANIIVRDFWLSGAAFSYLEKHRFLGHVPVISEVAYREARNRLKARAELLLSNRAEGASLGNTRRLIRLFNFDSAPDNDVWDISDMLRRWDSRVRSYLAANDGRVAPIPDVNVAELMDRSILRRRPFSDGDKGFRDTLIWLGALDLVAEDSRVSFITRNARDFFSEASSEPHPDILEEATEAVETFGWRMQFHQSLDEFILHFDSDRSTSAEALRRALTADAFRGLSLRWYLEQNLPSLFVGGDILDEIRWCGVNQALEAPLLRSVEEVVCFDVGKVRHLRDEVYRVYCDFAFIGEFHGSILYTPVEEVLSDEQVVWCDESDASWTEVGFRAVGTILVGLDVDVERSEVVNFLAHPLEHWTTYKGAIEDMEEFELESQDTQQDEAST